LESVTQPKPKQNTTVSHSEDGSLATQPTEKKNYYAPVPAKNGKKGHLVNWAGYEIEDNAFNRGMNYLNNLIAPAYKSVLETADNAVKASSKMLQQEGFFDDDIPDTDTPVSDAMLKKHISKETHVEHCLI